MYISFFIFLMIILFLFFTHFFRHRKIVRKIRTMCTKEKCKRLNELINPFGYFYNYCRDSFHSTTDAWQKSFGYGRIYDRLAPHFNMIFDTLPVYFDYNERTWLIQFWKGQYGINTGAEIGIYKSDRLLSPDEYDSEIFRAVSKTEWLPLSMNLNYSNVSVGRISMKHWWLTSFKIGVFSDPDECSTDVSISFPNYAMLAAFTDSLSLNPLAPKYIRGTGLTVHFIFNSTNSGTKTLYISWKQMKNRFYCWLFNRISQPFTLSLDQLLYLYEYLPFAFRKIINIHSKRQYKCKKRR